MCNRLIDSSVIAVRLRLAMEQLFQTSNQAAYLGSIHRSAAPLTRCMIDRLHSSLDGLGQIVQEIEPKVIDTGSLTLEAGSRFRLRRVALFCLITDSYIVTISYVYMCYYNYSY